MKAGFAKVPEWETVLDTFLTTNELPLLRNAGSLSAKRAEAIAHQRYETFDAKRRAAEREAAERTSELEELEQVVGQVCSMTSSRRKR